MSDFVSALFGGGGEKERKVEPPREDEASRAKSEARRRLSRGFTQRDTLIGGMFDQGLKTKLGA